MEIKKGDKIRALVDYHDIKKGEIYTVLEGSDTNSHILIEEYNEGRLLTSCEYELVEDSNSEEPKVEPEPLEKPRLPKIGDKIRCIESIQDFSKGTVYEIVELDSYNNMNPNCIDDVGDKDSSMNDNRWEFVEETETIKGFKVGDRIKIVGEIPQNIEEGLEGMGGVIKEVCYYKTNGFDCYDIQFDSGRYDTGFMNEGDLELAKENETPKVEEVIEEEKEEEEIEEESPISDKVMTEVKKGNRVKALKKDTDITKGNIYIVESICEFNTVYFQDDKDERNCLSFDDYEIVEVNNNKVNGLGSAQSVSGGDTASFTKPCETHPVKQTFMETLRKIPSTLKRHLNPNLKAMYKVGFINGDLALTDTGKSEILNYLITTKAVEEAIATVAKEIIKENKEDK